MSKQTDRELIACLGGPTKVAELLNLPKYGGVQRVQNWTQRGIPAAVKVAHPRIFMPELTPALATTTHPATENVAHPDAEHPEGEARHAARRNEAELISEFPDLGKREQDGLLDLDRRGDGVAVETDVQGVPHAA